ncbi:hypothetical protein OEZ86_012569 [Tetradesmus obliquus]|nr:hypothetical protein OEZ86_012569 [Tetradesmus obliquus]
MRCSKRYSSGAALLPYKPGSSRDPCRLAVGKTSLEVHEDPLAGTHVPNLLYVDVQSSGQVLQLVAAGNCNRATAHTDRNQHSSRSHAILQFWLEQRPPAGAAAARDSTVVRSKLNFVDLAGSERWGKAHTEAEGGKLELTSINNSLSALAQVVAALTDRSAKHVPYRSSRLTHLLQDSLGGNCCTSLIVTLAPCADAFQESLATLRFADRARNIANRAVVNSAHDTDTILAIKEREIQRLRALLASYASAGGGLRSLDSSLQQQQQQQQQQWGAEGGEGGAEQQCVKEDQQQEPALQSLALLLPPSSPSTPFAPISSPGSRARQDRLSRQAGCEPEDINEQQYSRQASEQLQEQTSQQYTEQLEQQYSQQAIEQQYSQQAIEQLEQQYSQQSCEQRGEQYSQQCTEQLEQQQSQQYNEQLEQLASQQAVAQLDQQVSQQYSDQLEVQASQQYTDQLEEQHSQQATEQLEDEQYSEGGFEAAAGGTDGAAGST